MDILSFSTLDAESAHHSCVSQRSRLRAYRQSSSLKVMQLLSNTGLVTYSELVSCNTSHTSIQTVMATQIATPLAIPLATPYWVKLEAMPTISLSNSCRLVMTFKQSGLMIGMVWYGLMMGIWDKLTR